MREEIPFLRAILAQPDDELVRLVYADWLDERADPRAELLRREVERHHLQEKTTKRSLIPKEWSVFISQFDPRWVNLVCHSRNLPTGARWDLVQVIDGKGLIEVRGGQDEIVLLVEGRPLAFNWDDCQGSVGQYLVFCGHFHGAEHSRRLAEFAADGVDPDRPLFEQIEPLLEVFPNGTYGLGYTPTNTAQTISTYGGPHRYLPDLQLYGYYPAADRNLIFTQPTETLNEKRVNQFRKKIRTGLRPVVITVSTSDA